MIAFVNSGTPCKHSQNSNQYIGILVHASNSPPPIGHRPKGASVGFLARDSKTPLLPRASLAGVGPIGLGRGTRNQGPG